MIVRSIDGIVRFRDFDDARVHHRAGVQGDNAVGRRQRIAVQVDRTIPKTNLLHSADRKVTVDGERAGNGDGCDADVNRGTIGKIDTVIDGSSRWRIQVQFGAIGDIHLAGGILSQSIIDVLKKRALIDVDVTFVLRKNLGRRHRSATGDDHVSVAVSVQRVGLCRRDLVGFVTRDADGENASVCRHRCLTKR